MSVNSKMTAIADAIRAKTGGTEPLTLDQMATEISGISAGDFLLNAEVVSILPAAVTDGQMVIISNVQAENIYFGYTAPTAPIAGDVWVHTLDIADGYSFSVGTINLKPGATMQYNGSAWDYRDAYIGINGAWVLFSTTTALEHLSWAQIDGIARSGEELSRFFSIGDTKSIQINSVTYDVEILGFNHDKLADGTGNARLTFGLKECLATKEKMDAGSTAVYWKGCDMRENLQTTIFEQLPADLKSIIKSVKKTSYQNATRYEETTDTLFLFSEFEVSGTSNSSFAGEGTQYPRFTDTSSRIKHVDGAKSDWWLRSLSRDNNTWFCYVMSNGTIYKTEQTSARGVCFGFCI